MNKKPNEFSDRLSDDDELTTHRYEGVDLAPSTASSLVIWDVSQLARHEQARLLAAYRAPRDVAGR